MPFSGHFLPSSRHPNRPKIISKPHRIHLQTTHQSSHQSRPILAQIILKPRPIPIKIPSYKPHQESPYCLAAVISVGVGASSSLWAFCQVFHFQWRWFIRGNNNGIYEISRDKGLTDPLGRSPEHVDASQLRTISFVRVWAAGDC